MDLRFSGFSRVPRWHSRWGIQHHHCSSSVTAVVQDPSLAWEPLHALGTAKKKKRKKKIFETQISSCVGVLFFLKQDSTLGIEDLAWLRVYLLEPCYSGDWVLSLLLRFLYTHTADTFQSLFAIYQEVPWLSHCSFNYQLLLVFPYLFFRVSVRLAIGI